MTIQIMKMWLQWFTPLNLSLPQARNLHLQLALTRVAWMNVTFASGLDRWGLLPSEKKWDHLIESLWGNQDFHVHFLSRSPINVNPRFGLKMKGHGRPLQECRCQSLMRHWVLYHWALMLQHRILKMWYSEMSWNSWNLAIQEMVTADDLLRMKLQFPTQVFGITDPLKPTSPNPMAFNSGPTVILLGQKVDGVGSSPPKRPW